MLDSQFTMDGSSSMQTTLIDDKLQFPILDFWLFQFKYWSFEVSKQGYLNVRIKDFLIFVHIESGAEFSGLESSNNCKRQQSCVPNRPSVSTITLRVEKSGKRTNKSFLKQTNSSWESESTKRKKRLFYSEIPVILTLWSKCLTKAIVRKKWFLVGNQRF